ncbi:trypsin-like peptidase domain-containing protein [Desulfobulbus sp. US4]|nr:trypsin-like peptidase domain-containing protein [Desulfobulbus sp. US4]
MKCKLFWLILSIGLVFTTPGFAEHNWTKQIAMFKPMVVNVERSRQIPFGTESKGKNKATGFIVDAERGIIATNQHVTGISPSDVKIHFYNGSVTEAKVLYYDPTHDFGFYKIDPSSIQFQLQAVTLGSGRTLKNDNELLLIGNNDAEEYSVKFGYVANLNVIKDQPHSSYIHTTFDRAGGSSGSPVWNTKGEVVGIHAKGTDVSSFELPIEYVHEALKQIQDGTSIQRGYIGVDLDLISIGKAIRHYNVPQMITSDYDRSFIGVPKVMLVESIIPNTSAEKLLRPGDIIYRLNEQLLRDDLYTFDAILNSHVGQTVELDIYRHGKLLQVETVVEDLEEEKIRRFVRFAGAIFHKITPSLRRMTGFAENGVYMPYADQGSSFSQLTMIRRNTPHSFTSKAIISEINGQAINNIDDLAKACQQIKSRQDTHVVVRDFIPIATSNEKSKIVTINSKYGPLELFELNPQTLDWDKIKLPLAQEKLRTEPN